MSNFDLNPHNIEDMPMGAAVKVTITLHNNGALSVEGPIHDQRWMIAVLENAMDAVRNHHMPKSKPGLIIPDRDVVVPDVTPKVIL